MIVAMGWRRDQVYVGNVIGCRPPGDRAPLPVEISTCQPFLLAQLGVVAPRVIVALGQVAANALLADETPISAQRGRFHDRNVAGHAVRIMPTFHPLELLQTPARKREAWADLQLVMAELTALGVLPGAR
ncbi:MAG: uracil-DNA glycosylase, partial [Kofleriaceae bacterium]|nr:uracil-DNA glycosylase [Kofleriaceae bacterium]